MILLNGVLQPLAGGGDGLRVVGKATSWGCLLRGTDLVVDLARPALSLLFLGL